LLILVELLTITQWVKMRGDFCWYWWKWLPSLNEFRWEVIFVDIGGIVDITQWVDVRGDSCWYWWNFDHHSMSLGERWFLLILVELLTIIQWVWLRGDFCWYWLNFLPSLNELRWDVIFIDIGGIVDHHSMSWFEGWFFLILVDLLTITQWVEGRGDFCWYWWNCWPSLNELNWEVIFVDIGGNDDHHSMSWDERWFLLILVKLLTITEWVKVRGDVCRYWLNCWP
jgi:hypothetical protein